jgi:hypothetical protein
LAARFAFRSADRKEENMRATTQLPAPAGQDRDTGAWQATIVPRVFAVFLVLHGLVHLIGFTVPWRLGGLRGSEYSTLVLNRSIEVGDTAVRLLGLMWLAAAGAFIVVGAMVWRGHPWARRAAVALLLGSAVLCTIDLPSSVMGLVIDIAVLALLAVAPRGLLLRPSSWASS